MERRFGFRARTDFGVVAREGTLSAHCRAVELSSTGIVLDRGHPVQPRDERILIPLELRLPERHRTIRAIGRHVRSFGSRQCLKFIRIHDADRLSLAEHLDLCHLRGTPLS
ncbi:MAG: hypothetical protein OZ921_13685 [Sorangiineae bacterium]|nr:hypothetical protein [Polyangiaceae bacterium]MEB2323558.1 hypothetical protein [Sorangiineae bacterium]